MGTPIAEMMRWLNQAVIDGRCSKAFAREVYEHLDVCLCEIERLRTDASYQVACHWRARYAAAAATIIRLRTVFNELAGDDAEQ